MHVRPTVTFEQYKATLAAVLAAKPKIVHERSWWQYVLLALICLAFGSAAQFDATRIPVLTLSAALILFWLFSKPLAAYYRERCLKRFYAEEYASLNDLVLTIDQSGISCDQGDGRAVSHRTWRAFIYFIDLPDAFVFLPSPNTFVRIPKEMLTPSEHNLVREWSSAIPRRIED